MTRSLTGLTLGKFAPLHAGHQYMIETALGEVDRLIVIVYDCPDVTPVPLGTRAEWIRCLYPDVEVIEALDGPRETGEDPAITHAHDEYIRKAIAGRRITHFYSSEFYGEHVSAALNAIDRRLDPARSRFPVSGSAIRREPGRHREFIAPRVYRDLIENVVLLGAPSTGKTTLCKLLAEVYRTTWMPEYGREYWEQRHVDRRLTSAQLVEIAEEHVEREERLLLEADRFLFTDTNALTTMLFARYYHACVPARLQALADLAASRYARTFVCADDIPYDDTWDRSGEISRDRMQQWTLEALADRAIPFVELRGSIEERMRRVAAVIGPPGEARV